MLKKILTMFVCLLAISPAGWSEESLPEQTPSFDIQTYQREQVIPFLTLLHERCAQSFAPFPYLYVPPADQIVSTADWILVNEKNALVVIVKKEEKVIGVAAGVALDSPYVAQNYFPSDLFQSMKEKGIDASDYFYVTYFLLDEEYRDNPSIAMPIYDTLRDFAASIDKTKMAYMDIIQPEAHPLRPNVSSSPEPWGTAITGFLPLDLFVEMEWPTFQSDGSVGMENHLLQFYSKPL